ncbi:hypothetical protein [Flagellimonas oceanensis]|uniref:hypothetical protein n=1 Tax=Flagellimonas oceanensis TaxID=2499163 RepID=UPI003BA8EB08
MFSFSFQFRLSRVGECHDMEMLSLPRPLDRGGLYLDEEKLQQSFRIDALGPITLRGGNASVPRHLPSGTAAPRCGKSKGYVRHFSI